MEKSHPSREQAEEQEFIGQLTPTLYKICLQLAKDSIFCLFFHMDFKSRVFDTRKARIAQSKSALWTIIRKRPQSCNYSLILTVYHGWGPSLTLRVAELVAITSARVRWSQSVRDTRLAAKFAPPTTTYR